MPNPPLKKKISTLENASQLMQAYIQLKKPAEMRRAYCDHFGNTERTFYNRLKKDGHLECSEAEKQWFCDYLVKPRKKLFPETQKMAA